MAQVYDYYGLSAVGSDLNKGAIPNEVINQNATVDDGKTSIKNQDLGDQALKNAINLGLGPNSNSSQYNKGIIHGVNLFSANEIRNAMYTKTFRFGVANPFTAMSTGREYLFFTRPDLHILKMNDISLETNLNELNGTLADVPFWIDLFHSRKETTIKALQYHTDTTDVFNHLLQNQCKSNLDIPGLSSDLIETPVNDFGIGYSYRGSSESSDDNPEFSLEFKDNKFLDTYYFFKAYEEYEKLKHHGVISPPTKYITNKILHDSFSIYKFIVADDMETIVYWGKMYGVIPKSLPRDVFSNPQFDDGISYSIDFKAAFYEDMIPEILCDFNYLNASLYNRQKYQINPYNAVWGRADTRPAVAAAVIKDSTSPMALMSPTGYVYKLKWRGSDEI